MPANNIFQIRRGPYSEWNSANPVLASGEPGYDITNNIYKIGDGTSNWNNLKCVLDITGNATISGILSASSGNFNNLLVSGIPVSISGHNHLSSDITDFNSSVSGLLPVIANSGDNRILTSTGSTVGVNAESNLTFDGSVLSVSGNLIVDTGNFSIIQLNTDNGPVTSQGQLGWNDTEGTVDIALTDTAIINIGEHEMYRIRNTTGNVLYKGQAVMASGVHANGIILPNLYTANGSVREIRFMGLVYENVNDNNNGYVIHFGHVNNIDTRGNVASNIAVGDETWVDGDILYVHPTVAGKLTKVEPKHSTAAAIILDAANNGKIFVRPSSYGHLNDNHDVSVSGATNGQFLQYNSSTDYWVPSSSGNFSTLSVNGSGVSLNGHTHSSSDITNFDSSVSGLLPTNLVTGIGANGYIALWSGIDNLTSGVIFDNGTNIGIGTDNPQATLQIITGYTYDNINDLYVPTDSSLGGAAQVEVFQIIDGGYESDGSQKEYVNLGRFHCNASHSRGSFSLSNNGTNGAWEDNVMQFFVHGTNYAHGYYGDNLSDAGCAMIVTQGQDIVKLQIGNYNDAPIEFFTNNTQRLKINNNGDVGIGIDIPLYQLDVLGTGNFSQNLLINGTEVSISGHSHSTSDITDFNSSVSGLLPVTNILGGTNISIVPSGSIFTVNVSGSLGLTTEEVDDRVSQLLVAGSGITLSYDDSSNFLSIDANISTSLAAGSGIALSYNSGTDELFINTVGLQPSGNYSLVGHTHTSSNITDFNSSVSGLLPVINITAGSGISISSSSGNFTISTLENIINSSNLYLWANFR